MNVSEQAEQTELTTEIAELIESVQLVTAPSGEKKAVLVEYRVWEELVELLEDLSDLREIRRIQESGEEPIPWEQFKEEMRAEGFDV